MSIRTSLWIAAGLAMAPAIALGLARFAYALLLPSMRTDLAWSYTDAGAMNTANALGYLVGALIASQAATRFGAKRAFLAGLLLTAATLLASGLTASFTWLIILRVIAGITGAVAFVIGAAFTVAAVPRNKPASIPLAMGVYLGGGGLGIVISALVVPPLLALAGWRGGWIILGAVSFLGAVVALPALRRIQAPAPRPQGDGQKGWSLRFLLPVVVSYGLFGAGYIAYMTFIVAYLRSRGLDAFDISVFWACLGTASLIAAFLWSPLLARFKAGWGLVAALGIVTTGALLPVVFDGKTAAFFSAWLFGGSFLAVVAAVTSFAGKAVKPHALTAVIAALTVSFGLGQCIGPVLSGAISDGPHGVQTGLLLSAGILLIGAIVAIFQREPTLN
ncbi:YbfB/YjiJ family MFS transporter [Paralcaligenes sp. KSB-10]|uniref:YbfB/YjiJ family MFS transporter n=1 Tax=Paralcaligenes sp. KSB-10 TaxID=2901142 RepID=UPI001E3E638E|nr:YbfB/YjiJ family MFS transporter [Paralcaligenes sp. KSB-10]UHL63487.1 YbfB/YjiJ family MFS transporter [Paralcaligenes sp. KSB-10]